MRLVDPAKAHEVAMEERARMQSMVPSCLRGEGREPLGPSARAVDPYTNEPMSTLYEVIQAKDVLKGKGRRGPWM
jgi:hypothetical protein